MRNEMKKLRLREVIYNLIIEKHGIYSYKPPIKQCKLIVPGTHGSGEIFYAEFLQGRRGILPHFERRKRLPFDRLKIFRRATSTFLRTENYISA